MGKKELEEKRDEKGPEASDVDERYDDDEDELELDDLDEVSEEGE